MVGKFWNRIHVKVVLVFIALLIPLCALMLYSTVSFVKTLEKGILENINSLLAVDSKDIEQEIRRIDYFLYRTQEWDTDYLGIVYSKDEGIDYIKLASLSTKMQSQIADMHYSQAIFFYFPAKDYTLLKYSSSLSEEADALQELLTEERLEEIRKKWNIAEVHGRIYYMHSTSYLGTYLGNFLDISSMLETIRSQIEYDDCRVVFEEATARSDENYIVVSTRFRDTGYFFNVYVSRQEVLGRLPMVTRFLQTAVIAVLLLIPVLLYVFWRIMVKPLNIIDEALGHLGKEPEYRIESFKASNEYLNLQHSLNHMVEEIQTLKIERYEKELEFERMKTINLMMQIRPHFLLNTFNQIYSMAELEDYVSIQTMSMYLAKYFRYLFDLKPLVSLGQELWVVRAFLDSMEIRYIGCFMVEWNVDESLMEYKIPPLLLHNFVENIFKYAVGEGTETAIRISIQKENEESGTAVITVADDGPGMEPDILKKINAGEPVEKSDGVHIGIWNSAYRLKTFLGEKSRLESWEA